MAAIMMNGQLYGSSNLPVTDASSINYDNTTTALSSTTVQGAIDESFNTLKSGLTNLDNEVNGDAVTYPYDDVITIPDAVPANVADCNVKIEPVQDLHGFDHPWVGGAGKNKFNPNLTSPTSNLDITVNPDGSITLDAKVAFTSPVFTNSGTVSLKANTAYTLSCDNTSEAFSVSLRNSDGSVVYAEVKTESGSVIYTPSSDTIAYMFIRVQTEAASVVTLKPQLEEGSTATDFAPYTNICPITGHTEASVQRDGKNLYSGGEAGSINQETGEDEPSGTVTRSYFINVVGGNSIALSHFEATSSGVRVFYYGKNKVYMTSQVFNFDTNNSIIVSRPNGCEWIRFQASNSVFSSTTTVQVELGSSATDYEPFKGKTYTISLGSTIYGGTVDFDSGVMTVDRVIVDFDGSDVWTISQTTGRYIYAVSDGKLGSGAYGYIKTSHYPYDPYGASGDNDVYWCDNQASKLRIIFNTSFATKADWLSYLTTQNTNGTPLQICYPLATPTTIQLTPQQIQLLQGQNTLTASTGQISVTVNGVSGAIGAVQTQANATDEALAELAEKLPTAPTTDGAYVLTVTVADGTPTYSWESAT